MSVGKIVPWLTVGFVAFGCGAGTKQGNGIPLEDGSPFVPPVTKDVKTKLILAGTTYPVLMTTSHKDEMVQISLFAHGEVFEVESYTASKSKISLTEAAEEKYAPGVDLLRFPMRVGDTWNWNGTMTTGGIEKKATATITSVSEKLYLGGASHDTVKVAVTLMLEANPNKKPLERKMAFWFESNKGIIKREFGPASKREPQEL